MLSRDWDIDIAEKEAEFRDDLRAASGIGKRRRKVCCCWIRPGSIDVTLMFSYFRKDDQPDPRSLNRYWP